MAVLLIELARTSAAVAATPARLAKIAQLAELLGRTEPGEAEIAISYLSGELPQRNIGVGWAALQDPPEPRLVATATLREVNGLLDRIKAQAGPGSQLARKALLDELFGAVTRQEQVFLSRLLRSELRQGALHGVMTEAVAKAAGSR